MARTPGSAARTVPRRLRALLAAADDRRYRLLAAALAVLSGLVVLLVSHELFPYHSANHDEGVYLQQAAMLLEGQLFVDPPVPDAMRPWFFVRDGGTMYPKYGPVPAAVFALGKAVAGSFRVALAGVAAANVALCYAVAAAAFDRRTGVLAAILLAASPLFLVNSAVFLPYAPTTMLNLAFALAYLRAARPPTATENDRSPARTLGYAAVAGAAAGLAFFARPFTALLFAVPFLVHAAWQLWASRLARPVLARHVVTAAFGLVGVGLALAYNAVVTGSPLVFPYEAFAPLDGLGFGHREILGYERDYDPALALRANAEVAWLLATRWVVAGPVGTLLALVGLAGALRALGCREPKDTPHPPALTDGQVQLLLAGVGLSVVVGNVYFWGNLNVLGSLADPDDGLLALLGPYYHFDVLVPVAAFAAHGALLVVGRFRAVAGRIADDHARARTVFLAGVVVGAAILGAAAVGVAADPVRENAEISDRYERAYAPFENRSLDDALVLLPDPYGDWLAHPFQALRNDPGFDGPTVYAHDRGEANFEVVDAYPDREMYRFVYRGDWAPTAGATVDSHLQRVRVAEGESVALDANLGVPAGVEEVTVRVAADGGQAYYTLNGTPANATLRLTVADGDLRLAGPAVEPAGDSGPISVGATDEVVVEAFLDRGAGRGFSYRLELPVERADGTVRAMTPYVEVCRVPDRCGGEAAYVPATAEAGVFVDVTFLSEHGR